MDLALGAGIALFHTSDGEPFAVVPADDHLETWPVRSHGFRLWLRQLFFQATRTTANTQAVEEVLGTLEGQALFDGDEEPVHLRVAEWQGRLYLDLGDRAWRVVEIGPDGWRVCDRSPVRFRRPRGLLALPLPVHGASSLDGLRNFLTVDDDGWRLVAGWLVGTLRPDRPFPVLALYGEPGSAKTTQAKLLRAMVDPNVADLRPCPREEYDLVLAAKNGWIIGFDNVSVIKPWLSDALCRVSTGIGFGRRQLYTDGDEYLLAVKRPIVLNGIEEVAVKGDLVDRAIVTGLFFIEEKDRREDEELSRGFELSRPGLLGALLDVVSGALSELPAVRLDRKPRMADFARWVTAAEPMLGWEPGSFVITYRRNRGQAITTTLEASLVVDPLRAVLANDPHRYEGPVSALLRRLRDHADERVLRDPDWPKDAIRLSGELRRLACALREIGVSIDFPKRKAGARRVIITMQAEKGGNGTSGTSSSSSARPSAASSDVHDDDDVGSGTLSIGGSNVTEREPGEEG